MVERIGILSVTLSDCLNSVVILYEKEQWTLTVVYQIHATMFLK